MFGAILPSRPVQTNLQTISATQFAFTLPASPPFHHIVIFMLPGNILPPDAAAAVYVRLPNNSEFKLLGFVDNEKQSAIFKVNRSESVQFDEVAAASETDDLMIDEIALPDAAGSRDGSGQDFTLGISVEPVANIKAQLDAQKGPPAADMASMVVARKPISTKMLARKIIRNAFNFLASFAGDQGGNEVVPLKSFQSWWTKFEKRIELDPDFLQRDDDG